MSWSLETSCGFESRKIKYLIPRYTRGRVLEIGCGTEKAFPHFIGIDSGHHFGKGAADIVSDANKLSLFADDSMDAVFSSHVLEHMVDMAHALNEWGRVIKPGGYLVLYVPSANLYPKCGELGANPDHKHDIYPGDIEKILESGDHLWTRVLAEERGDEDEYSLFEVYRKGKDKVVNPGAKTACVVRFGGFGDMLQAASVLPGLKEQGFHVTVMTTPKGKDVICMDPNVDDWFILDQDQVPNGELTGFFHVQSKRYDRFINLCESVEGTLLAMQGRANHSWPQEVRHKMMNKNYHEFTAELAGVPLKPCRLFYPEANAVSNDLSLKIMQSFTVLWALAGSSVHKFTPHQDAVIARILLECPEAHIVFVGDEACRILEQGWENEPRISCMSGKLNIRQTLSLAQRMNLVIGPETGVLNSVAFEESVSKICLLSHSSHNNLTKHWIKTQALVPFDCDCYPCHRLHYSTYFCDIDEATGAAQCAVKIKPDVIWDAVKKVYQNWRRK